MVTIRTLVDVANNILKLVRSDVGKTAEDVSRLLKITLSF